MDLGHSRRRDDCDLYAEDLQHVLTSDQPEPTIARHRKTVSVAGEVERLRRPESVVLVFPTGWFGVRRFLAVAVPPVTQVSNLSQVLQK